MKWKLKGCARCSGDLYILNEDGFWYEGCLQCGYQNYLPNDEISENEEVNRKYNLEIALRLISGDKSSRQLPQPLSSTPKKA